jgi:hypothetical protein
VAPVLLDHDQFSGAERPSTPERQTRSDEKSDKAGHVRFQLTQGYRYLIV